jgi:hypothetical protein
MGKNQVINGDYKGSYVIIAGDHLQIAAGIFKTVKLIEPFVESAKLISHEESAGSGGKAGALGLAGGLLLGPVGAIAGAAYGMGGSTSNIIEIELEDCKACTVEVTRGDKDTPALTPQPTSDPVAEITKYKGLLDAGVITQEDFNAKKKQLLGL